MPTGPGTTEQFQRQSPAGKLDLVLSRFKHSETYHQQYMTRTKRWYDLYRGIYSQKFQSYRNNVHIPFIFSVLQSDVARKALTVLGVYPYLQFLGDDSGIARKNEHLISLQMDDCNTFPKACDFILTADLYGTAICRLGWRTLRRKEKVRLFDKNTNAEHQITETVTRFDGPDWDVIDVLDFFPQPGIRRIQDMAWVIHRYWMDLDDMKSMAMGDDDYFVGSALNQLKLGNPPDGASRLIERYDYYRQFGDWEARKKEKFAKPVEIKEYVGLVPSEFAPDGVRMRIIAVANDRVIVKDDPFPFWHGDLSKMFLSYSPMPDPHYFHGSGMAEVMEKLQITANRFLSQQLDAMEATADPMYAMLETTGMQGPIFTRAGRIITVSGAQSVQDAIMPLVPNTQCFQDITGKIEQLWRHMQQGSGIAEDVVQGMQTGGRQTAREFVGRQESVMTRIGLGARLLEDGWFEPMGNAFRALNRQFLKMPKEIRMLGRRDALMDSITGNPLPADPTKLDLEDINPDYRARAVGASQMMGKSGRQQNLLALLTAASQNPVAQQIINWKAMFTDLFKTFDIENTDELFVKKAEEIINNLPAAQGLVSNSNTNNLLGTKVLDNMGMNGTQPPGVMAGMPSMEGGGLQ